MANPSTTAASAVSRITDAPTGCHLIVSTTLDRCGTHNAAAWLAERASVPIVYFYSG